MGSSIVVYSLIFTFNFCVKLALGGYVLQCNVGCIHNALV